MTAKRPPIQLTLDLTGEGRGEAPRSFDREAEAATATDEAESPAGAERLMEAICDFENVETAARAVMRNKGGSGVDGMTVKELPGVLNPTSRIQPKSGTQRQGNQYLDLKGLHYITTRTNVSAGLRR